MRLLTLRTVLVATDLTTTSHLALEAGRMLAAAAGATLHVAHVAPAGDQPAPEDMANAAHAHGLRAALAHADAPVADERFHILTGEPAPAIASLASSIGADLIVLGRHRDHRPGEPVGSTAYATIGHATAPCLVITRPFALPLRRVLAATDLTDTARGALLVALAWASALRERGTAAEEPELVAIHVGAKGRVAHADEQEIMEHELALVRESAGSWAGVQLQGTIDPGEDPATAIVAYAVRQRPDLVVMGTRALRLPGNSELGSISDAVVRHLDLPVLLVPPAVWRAYARDLAEAAGVRP